MNLEKIKIEVVEMVTHCPREHTQLTLKSCQYCGYNNGRTTRDEVLCSYEGEE